MSFRPGRRRLTPRLAVGRVPHRCQQTGVGAVVGAEHGRGLALLPGVLEQGAQAEAGEGVQGVAKGRHVGRSQFRRRHVVPGDGAPVRLAARVGRRPVTQLRIGKPANLLGDEAIPQLCVAGVAGVDEVAVQEPEGAIGIAVAVGVCGQEHLAAAAAGQNQLVPLNGQHRRVLCCTADGHLAGQIGKGARLPGGDKERTGLQPRCDHVRAGPDDLRAPRSGQVCHSVQGGPHQLSLGQLGHGVTAVHLPAPILAVDDKERCPRPPPELGVPGVGDRQCRDVLLAVIPVEVGHSVGESGWTIGTESAPVEHVRQPGCGVGARPVIGRVGAKRRTRPYAEVAAYRR